MKNLITYLFKLSLSWFSVFFLFRLIALIYFFKKIDGNYWEKFTQIIFHSLRLDWSVVGYLMLVPILFSLPLFFLKNYQQVYLKLNRYFFHFFFILIYLIAFVNLNLLREWGEKITKKSINIFINYPYEATISGYSSGMIFTLFLFFVVFMITHFVYSKWIFRDWGFNLNYKKSWIWLILVVLNILIIRGGWQLSPINQSMAYFSKNSFENYLATNVHWELFQEYIENKDSKAKLYQFGLNTDQLFNNASEEFDRRPIEILDLDSNQQINIVLIILESFTADLIEPLGGLQGITPNFNDFAKKGILFTNFYASGNRTEKGLLAIESSFPSQAFTSVILQPHKVAKLPSLIKDFNAAGYHTSFYYGGESEFFSMKSYFLNQQVDTLIDLDDFPNKLHQSKWGIYDEHILNRHIQDMGKVKEPFFSTVLTLSNHEPFSLPVKPHFNGGDEPTKFKSTAYYVDSVLNTYFQKVSKEKWYPQTLFVLVADHGHRLPLDKYDIQDFQRYRIPFLLFGEPIKKEWQGKIIDDFASQTDIRASLNSLAKNKYYQKDSWSRNLFIPDSTRAIFYDWDGGFGFRSKQFDYAFDVESKKDIRFSSQLDSSQNSRIKKQAKTYMQKIVETYLNLEN